jgi:hypothetical protein
MASSISAGNATNGVVVSSDNTGALNLITGSGSGTTALSIDSSQNVTTAANLTVTGTLTSSKGVTGTPAFSAYYTGAGQSIATATFVKIILNTEEFDTNNNFDSTTNYRFTPTVAGYYQINGQAAFTTFVAGGEVAIFKNGSQYKNGNNANPMVWATVSALIYLNGTTDYVELYAAQISGSTQTTTSTNIANNYFNGVLVRAA